MHEYQYVRHIVAATYWESLMALNSTKNSCKKATWQTKEQLIMDDYITFFVVLLLLLHAVCYSIVKVLLRNISLPRRFVRFVKYWMGICMSIILDSDYVYVFLSRNAVVYAVIYFWVDFPGRKN